MELTRGQPFLFQKKIGKLCGYNQLHQLPVGLFHCPWTHALLADGLCTGETG